MRLGHAVVAVGGTGLFSGRRSRRRPTAAAVQQQSDRGHNNLPMISF